MTRAAKRDVDRDELRESWGAARPKRSGSTPGGSRRTPWPGKRAGDAGKEAGRETGSGPAPGNGAAPSAAAAALDWAVAHLSEREAVFARTGLLAAALAWNPGRGGGRRHRARGRGPREKAGTLHAARLPGAEGLLTTDRAVADEREDGRADAGGRAPGRPADARPAPWTRRSGAAPLTAGRRRR